MVATSDYDIRSISNFDLSFENDLFSTDSVYFSGTAFYDSNGVDPEKYLAKCIELAAGIKPNDRKEWDRLLPWNLSKEFDLEY